MFYYIDQPHTPSFPIVLVKTESDFIVRSVETDLRRGMLVVAVISVDAYPYLAFSELTCHFCMIVRRLNLEVMAKKLLYQQVKIPG